MLSFDIAGIPREYLQYLLIIEKESTEALREKMQLALRLDKKELECLGNKASTFIKTKKTNRVQSGRIWDYVNKH